jgi:hypothetical protein
MKAVFRVGCAGVLGAMSMTGRPADVRAITLPLTRSDMERAAALARWPHSDAERARFHERYLVTVNEATIESWTVEQVEVITEFRRVELMAEEHERINDLWGRGGVRDIEDATRPWRGRVSVVAHLGLRASGLYVGGAPPADITLRGPGAIAPLDVRRTDLHANCDGTLFGCAVTGGLVEGIFDAATIGQTQRLVTVVWKGTELARVTIDFAGLE